MFSLDANVLVYAFDTTAGPRHARALTILAHSRLADCHLSLQAIGEFFVASRRSRPEQSAMLAGHATDLSTTFPCLAPNGAALRSALHSAGAGRLQYWDALLLATLREAGCSVLLSEDMQHGADYEGVKVLNPFLGDELSDDIAALLDVA
jgi:predicted nucleic acid-binding protein